MKHSYFLFTSCLLLLSSCGIYRSNVVNTPLLSHAGQTEISAGAGFNGFDLQGSTAFTDHFALMANSSYSGSNVSEGSGNRKIEKHIFGEVALGIYKKNPKTGWITELYVGGGKGIYDHQLTYADSGNRNLYNGVVHANYNRFFVQLNSGFRKNNFEFALTPRLLTLSYYGIVDHAPRITDFNSAISNGTDHNLYPLFESAITFRYGFKNIRFFNQMAFTLPLYKTSPERYNDFSPINLSIGMSINMNLFKKQKKDVAKDL